MELRHFRYFLAVADEASFVRAAARLHLSQPPLSLQIRDLEEELGVKLFDRSNRGVTLTAAGEAFYPEAQAVMARAARARDAARHAGCGEIGRLTAGFVSIADYSLLPEALRIFRQRYPKVELVLREETADVQTRLLLDAEIDVGLALAPIDDGRIEFESLLVERLLLAVPSTFVRSRSAGSPPRSGGSRPSLAQHANDAFILPPRVLAPGLHDSVLQQRFAEAAREAAVAYRRRERAARRSARQAAQADR